MIYALICINNHIFSCLINMLSVVEIVGGASRARGLVGESGSHSSDLEVAIKPKDKA